MTASENSVKNENKSENEPTTHTYTLSDGSVRTWVDNRTPEEQRAESDERRKKWREENPKQAAENRLRSSNLSKYRESGVLNQEVPHDYLHQQSYEQRLAKAEALNGCQFKDSPPYKSKAWGEPMDRVLHDKNDGFANLCDGQIATLSRLNGFVTFLSIMQFICVVLAILVFPITGPLWISPVLLLLAIGMNYFKNVVEPYDQFVFERHNGLIKTPHNWWRRAFYIPFEDIECYDGGVVKSARGGGARSTAKFRCMKTPKRYYLTTPQFILRFGGLRQVTWASYLAFMDTSQPVLPRLHQSIEYYYSIDKNALLTAPFPEVMKQYLDADDIQVNREDVW